MILFLKSFVDPIDEACTIKTPSFESSLQLLRCCTGLWLQLRVPSWPGLASTSSSRVILEFLSSKVQAGRLAVWDLSQSISELHSCGCEDEISFGAATSACEKGGEWEAALILLNKMPEVSFMPWKPWAMFDDVCTCLESCFKMLQTHCVLSSSALPFCNIFQVSLPIHTIVLSAAVTACEGMGKWQMALSLYFQHGLGLKSHALDVKLKGDRSN